MTELERLKEEKKALEARIKELEGRTVFIGRVKLQNSYNQYRSHGEPIREWKLSIVSKSVDYEKRGINKSITISKGISRKSVIKDIDNIIADLQAVRDKALREEGEE